MTYEVYRYIFIGSAILCGIMFLLSVFLFIFFKIPKVIGDLSGFTEKKSIDNIRKKNAMSDQSSKISNKDNKEKITDKISASKKAPLATSSSETGVTEKISTQNLAKTEETTVLNLPENETTLLNNDSIKETSALMQEDNNYNVFEIECDITFIHSDEIII